MGRALRILAAGIVPAALMFAAPASQGAVQFGSNLSGDQQIVIACPGCVDWNTTLPAANTAGTVTSPINGVVTSFSVLGAPATGGNPWGPTHIQVVRAASGGQWSGFGISTPDVTPSNGPGLQNFPVRVPIAAGDYVGIYTGNSVRAGLALNGASVETDFNPFPANGGPTGDPQANPGIAIALLATAEPDSDCDGFGDETQDHSPPASSRGACACPPSRATIVGTNDDDLLVGTPGRDVIKGLSGRDKILGLGGADVICGDDGADHLIGGSGRDRLIGGSQADRLHGGTGRDSCRGERARSCER